MEKREIKQLIVILVVLLGIACFSCASAEIQHMEACIDFVYQYETAYEKYIVVLENEPTHRQKQALIHNKKILLDIWPMIQAYETEYVRNRDLEKRIKAKFKLLKEYFYGSCWNSNRKDVTVCVF